MSALGNRLLRLADEGRWTPKERRDAFRDAALVADEHETAAFAESAQGRGPHAAAALRWLADILSEEGAPDHAKPEHLRTLADEAER